jgi:hypothetical protein
VSHLAVDPRQSGAADERCGEKEDCGRAKGTMGEDKAS